MLGLRRHIDVRMPLPRLPLCTWRLVMGEDSGSSSAADDLDEVIEYAREIKTRSTWESANYSTTLFNLAPRLTHRYSMRGDPADHTEFKLLQELQSLSPPGWVKSGLAITQLGHMVVDKFNKTDALEDLREALGQGVKGIDELPQIYEGKPPYINQIATIYSSRYKKTNNITDLCNAVHYSNMTLATVPVSHGINSDIIKTFLGTFTVLNESFHIDMLCGPPVSTFDLALLWVSAGRLLRRGHPERYGELSQYGGQAHPRPLVAYQRGHSFGGLGPGCMQCRLSTT